MVSSMVSDVQVDGYNNNDENFRMVAEILTVIGVMDDSNNFWC